MKKKHLILCIFFFVFTLSLFALTPLHGIWLNKGLYDAWKSGVDDELLVPIERFVDGISYIAFPHQLKISNDFFIAGDGGDWRIISYQINDNRIIYYLASIYDTNAHGSVEIVFVNENFIYFDTYAGDEVFKREMEYSSIQFGKDKLLVRAERRE